MLNGKRWFLAAAVGLSMGVGAAQATPVIISGPEASTDSPPALEAPLYISFADLAVRPENFFDDSVPIAKGADPATFVDLDVISSMVFGPQDPLSGGLRGGGGRGIPVVAPAPWLLLVAGLIGWYSFRRIRA